MMHAEETRLRGDQMDIDYKNFRARDGKNVDLKDWPTEVKPYYESKKQLKKMLRARVEKMSDMQSRLYASNRYAVLLIFQAMDAAGKDSAIKHVMSGVNPQGCQVFSFLLCLGEIRQSLGLEQFRMDPDDQHFFLRASTSPIKIGSSVWLTLKNENFGMTI